MNVTGQVYEKRGIYRRVLSYDRVLAAGLTC